MNERNSHSLLAHREDALALIVDVQERLLPAMHDHAAVLDHVCTLISGMQALAVPVLCTEQYPRGLGRTVPVVAGLLGDGVIEKTAFGCLGEPGFVERLEATGRRTLFLCGIETHVCVLQTALAARERGYRVHVVADAVGSRRAADRELGLLRMREAGCVISQTEMALFELLERAGTPEFKAILPLVK